MNALLIASFSLRSLRMQSLNTRLIWKRALTEVNGVATLGSPLTPTPQATPLWLSDGERLAWLCAQLSLLPTAVVNLVLGYCNVSSSALSSMSLFSLPYEWTSDIRKSVFTAFSPVTRSPVKLPWQHACLAEAMQIAPDGALWTARLCVPSNGYVTRHAAGTYIPREVMQLDPDGLHKGLFSEDCKFFLSTTSYTSRDLLGVVYSLAERRVLCRFGREDLVKLTGDKEEEDRSGISAPVFAAGENRLFFLWRERLITCEFSHSNARLTALPRCLGRVQLASRGVCITLPKKRMPQQECFACYYREPTLRTVSLHVPNPHETQARFYDGDGVVVYAEGEDGMAAVGFGIAQLFSC